MFVALCSETQKWLLHVDKLVSRAHNLVANYKENGVKTDKFLMRLPATWQGIQAAKQLESEGIAAHVTLVYRCGAHCSMHLPTCLNVVPCKHAEAKWQDLPRIAIVGTLTAASSQAMNVAKAEAVCVAMLYE